ncbi:MAG TPA: protoporphyrinogen oxidase [Acidimicrobiales bacterium]|nr:protoporphyrinogen oxidase [Acidimicrobiales bacterium]
MTARVAVVGGGITGLAAAWELLRSGAEVMVLESSDHLGGKIVTDDIGGHRVDLGPDAFVARTPEATELCRELGLEDDLVTAATDHASVWVGGRLRPLPRDILLGVPSRLRSVARSGILSPGAVARLALDGLLPRRRAKDSDGDTSVGDLVAARLGRQVHDRLVDPLFGGIHAGPSKELSVLATAPQLAAAASSRSLMRGVRAQRGDEVRPSFHSLRGGMGQIVGRLEEELRDGGAIIRLESPVDSVPVEGADATIVATPAHITAGLVTTASPDAAAELRSIHHASVTVTVLVYPASAFPDPPDGSGFLVPRSEQNLITACSFGSSKWPHWAEPDEVVLRVSAGRFGDERALEMKDVELVQHLHNELVEVLQLTQAPVRARVTRWVDAFPQYRVGHLDRVASMEAALRRDLPGVEVVGAAYRGLGITTCIAQGRAAARRVLASVDTTQPAADSGVHDSGVHQPDARHPGSEDRDGDFEDVEYLEVVSPPRVSAWATVELGQTEQKQPTQGAEPGEPTSVGTSWPTPSSPGDGPEHDDDVDDS